MLVTLAPQQVAVQKLYAAFAVILRLDLFLEQHSVTPGCFLFLLGLVAQLALSHGGLSKGSTQLA